MARFTSNTVLDQPLDYFKNNTTAMHLTAGEPTDFNDATVNKSLAEVSIDSTDFTKTDASISGRKVTVSEISGVSINSSGDGDHVALVDANSNELLHVTTTKPQTVTAGNTMTFPSFNIEFRGPSAP